MRTTLLRQLLAAKSDEEFEELVHALVLVEHPTARRLDRPDGGADTVVPARDDRRALVWQAKRFTDRIRWDQCRDSLDTSVAQWEPEEFRFVFPRDLNVRHQPSLQRLQSRYRSEIVRVEEPWTVSTLREKLADQPTIARDHHLEDPADADARYQRQLEEATGWQRRWSQQLEAALRGPLIALGLEEAERAAREQAAAGDLVGAGRTLQALAGTIREQDPAIADAVLMRAGRLIAEQDRAAGGQVHLEVSRSALRRGDDLGDYCASRAMWEVTGDDRWRAEAAAARAAWAEEGAGALDPLREAVARAEQSGDPDAVLEWGGCLVEALCCCNEWAEALDVARDVTGRLEPPAGAGERLDLELDLLDARARAGEVVTGAFAELLLAPAARDHAAAAQVLARLACVLAREGLQLEAQERFRQAAERLRAAHHEDEVGEALLSTEAVSQLLGRDSRLDAETRVVTIALRGRETTSAVLADRRELEGLQAWLEDRGFDARRRLTRAWALHRRAGHLHGQSRLAATLVRLFELIEEPVETLRWAAESGAADRARTAARALDWSTVFSALPPAPAPWERTAGYTAVAAVGHLAPDEDARDLASGLLLAAAEDPEPRHVLRPAVAARHALASLICALPTDARNEALPLLRDEVEHSPFPPQQILPGLMRATDAQLTDERPLLAEVLASYHEAHLPGYHAAVGLLRGSPAESLVADQARTGGDDALHLAARLELPDNDTDLADRCANRTRIALDDDQRSLRVDDLGRLARWSTDHDQERVAAKLLTGCRPRYHDAHRIESARGLTTLAPGLGALAAGHLLDQLREAEHEIEAPTELTNLQSHPNRHLARNRGTLAAAPGAVRASAHAAEVALALRSDRVDELHERMALWLADDDPDVCAQATATLGRLPQLLPDADLAAHLADLRPAVRAAAVEAAAARDGVDVISSRLLELTTDPDASVRMAVLHIGRTAGAAARPLLEALLSDQDSYLRAAARSALEAGGEPR